MEEKKIDSYEGLSSERKKTSIGGQALLEGILMRGPEFESIAVRKANGEIELKVDPVEKRKFNNIPILRGIVNLFDSFKKGSKALEYSASFDDEYEEESTNKVKDFLFISLVVVLVIGIFFILPTFLVSILRPYFRFNFLLNLFEGLIRIVIFLIYVLAISKDEDIKRVFMYHGAEHKTINTYEAGEDLTVENVRKHSRLHPRCGTSFMFNLIIIGAIIFSILDFKSPIIKVIVRILFIPLLVGITYELNKWMGRSDSKISNIMSKAGMFLQRIATVREPDDSMIEVAIVAMKSVIPEDESLDIW